jgi:hypothetical protein
LVVLYIDEVVLDATRDQRVDAVGDLAGPQQRGYAAGRLCSLGGVGAVVARDLEEREDRWFAGRKVNDLNGIQGPGECQQALDL